MNTSYSTEHQTITIKTHSLQHNAVISVELTQAQYSELEQRYNSSKHMMSKYSFNEFLELYVSFNY